MPSSKREPEEVVLNDEGGKKWVAFKYPNGITITHNDPSAGGNMRVKGTDEKMGVAIVRAALEATSGEPRE